MLKGWCKVPPECFLLRTEHPELFQSLFTGEVLQPSYDPCILWTCFNSSFPCRRGLQGQRRGNGALPPLGSARPGSAAGRQQRSRRGGAAEATCPCGCRCRCPDGRWPPPASAPALTDVFEEAGRRPGLLPLLPGLQLHQQGGRGAGGARGRAGRCGRSAGAGAGAREVRGSESRGGERRETVCSGFPALLRESRRTSPSRMGLPQEGKSPSQ